VEIQRLQVGCHKMTIALKLFSFVFNLYWACLPDKESESVFRKRRRKLEQQLGKSNETAFNVVQFEGNSYRCHWFLMSEISKFCSNGRYCWVLRFESWSTGMSRRCNVDSRMQ
jgi:hypothetical protein